MRAPRAIGLALLLLLAGGCEHAARPAPAFVNIPYATWSNDEPAYRLFPGDEIDVAVPSAPELDKSVVVGPDGRIMLPLIGPLMAADRTPLELERAISAAYGRQVLRPAVEVMIRAQPLKVFVGGEVGKPGVYDMPGDIDALRAIVEAGGFLPTSKRSDIIIIRRARGGGAMMRTVDLARLQGGGPIDLVPLRRFDIVYVPKTGIGKIDDFMTGIRNALPIQFSYAFGSTVY